VTTAGVRFDLRRAPFSALTDADLYRETLAMSKWADAHGFASVVVSEHHGVDFISSPIAMAGVILGATERASVTVSALLLPLHDPVRIAEDIATLDLMSGGGRLHVVAGTGYRHVEFEMAGVDRRRRGALLEEYVSVMLQAWTGEPFEWRGRTIVVTPTPVSPALSLLLVGGSVKASAERAARLRLGFATMSKDPALGEHYRRACEAAGFEYGFFNSPTGPSFVHVTEDPERGWAEIGEYAVYDASSYSSWQTGDHDNAVDMGGRSTVEELDASGMWKVVTPDECVELAHAAGSVVLHPLMGGMPPDIGWASLELFADKVLPRLSA
jgi:alkanesulfonate monooxygenase SsuD/methylene tetrahydromethanopterin reductase-like flavin-dependent oxidoreductase (luciferase family)